MADTKKLNQAANIAGGIGGVGLSWLGSYFNTPKATGNEGYLHDANVVGNWNFGRTDMQGLLSQYESVPALSRVSGKDFFNPSSGEIFGSLFGAGVTSYGAAKGLTDNIGINLKGGNKAQAASQSLNSPSEGVYGSGIYGESDITPEDRAATSDILGKYLNGCGGHLHGCGGHKYANGGPSFNWGNAIGEGINLASAGIGIGLNYLGIQDQIRKSEREAAEVNAANAYARQLMEHNFNQAVEDTKNNMFNQQALQMMAMGGDLQTQGADFPLYGDFNVIGAGGTHEQNPFGGVFQGMAIDGRPNLVEEDEVVWNDYVFSNRIKIPASIADTYKLREGITYAEAAKKLSKESEERPNDPISQNGLTAALDDLMQSQESAKAKRNAARARRAIAKMSPEEVLNMMEVFQNAQQQPMEQQVSVEQQPTYAEGGHLFPYGGFETLFEIDPRYQNSIGAQYIPYVRDMNKDQVIAKESEQSYKDWTDYVNANWDTEEVQNYLRKLDATAGGNKLFDKNGKIKKDAKAYFNKARNDHKWGYYHLTPELLEASTVKPSTTTDVKEEVDNPTKNEKDSQTDKIEDVKTTDSKTKAPLLPTWMRYAPLLSGFGMLQGPAKDYSTGVSPRQATYVPIGDYLPYLPVDTQRYINAENQQAAAQLNAIMNASAGNRNMAMAQAALANQQRQQGIGQRMQAVEQINWDRLRQAGEFNRGTNMFKAQAHNQAELANLQNNPLLLRQAQHNQMMRYQADRDRDAAISASANAFLDSLSGIGRENLAWNQANSNEALRYLSRPNGYSGYKAPPLSDEDVAAIREALGNQKKSKQPSDVAVTTAFGGYLMSKNTKKNRR